LWIPSPNSGVTCYWDLEKHVYGWVECSSQAVGNTSVLKDNFLFVFLSYFMSLIDVLNSVYVNVLLLLWMSLLVTFMIL
jgi:hypothetical protein